MSPKCKIWPRDGQHYPSLRKKNVGGAGRFAGVETELHVGHIPCELALGGRFLQSSGL